MGPIHAQQIIRAHVTYVCLRRAPVIVYYSDWAHTFKQSNIMPNSKLYPYLTLTEKIIFELDMRP